jgi:hypothetical protein
MTIAFSALVFRGITVDTRALKTTERSMCIEDSLAPHAARGRVGAGAEAQAFAGAACGSAQQGDFRGECD